MLASKALLWTSKLQSNHQLSVGTDLFQRLENRVEKVGSQVKEGSSILPSYTILLLGATMMLDPFTCWHPQIRFNGLLQVALGRGS